MINHNLEDMLNQKIIKKLNIKNLMLHIFYK